MSALTHLEYLRIDINYFLVDGVDLYNIIIVFIVVIDKVIDYTLLIYDSFYEFFFTALQLGSNFGLIIL